MPSSKDSDSRSQSVPEKSFQNEAKPVKFEYLPPTPDMRSALDLMDGETTKEKFIRKFSEQPLIPIGCGLTATALGYGLIQMKTGNQFMSQRMMRLRILAQGFTVIACLVGVLHTAKSKRSSVT